MQIITMPVQFKGSSEYKTHYKWQESFRDRHFQPSTEQALDPAGRASVNASMTVEPPIQHKKRLDGPPTSLSTNYFDVPSKQPDYTLLGQQEKFASNVRYQPKQTTVVKSVYKNKENMGDDQPPNKQLRMQKRIKPLIKERHPPIREQRVAPPPPREEVSSPCSPPPAPRTHKDNFELKEAMRDKDLKDILGEEPMKKSAPGEGSKQPIQRKVPVERSAPTKDGKQPVERKGEEPVSNMNEFVQTNMGKGVALSGPEAPAEYSLKYKAKVAPPRPLKKMSEYQKQFQWKDGMKASPLLAAEQIVYQSSADLGPYKSDAIPKRSEYQRQFQEWSPQDLNLNNNADHLVPVEKKSIKRSKSAGAVPKLEELMDVEEEKEESSKEELKTKLKKTHGKIRKLGTEYRNNFKAPTSYSYDHGAWKGASPPQLFPQEMSQNSPKPKDDNNNNNNNAASEEPAKAPLSNWFAEVVELRRRAQEYRKRAQGTHFSREHLVQLMAKQNVCWDLDPEGSDTIRALDLDVPSRRFEVERVEKPSERMVKTEKVRGRQSRKIAWLEEQKENLAQQRRQLDADIQQAEEPTEEIQEGRLSTPILHGDKPARRHHLDLTTPAVGGALLTCPPSRDTKIIITSRSGDSYVTASDEMPVKPKQQYYDLDELLTMPMCGKPSLDTHYLRDDTAQSDRPLVTHYVASPDCLEDKENQRVVKSKGSKRAKASNLTTIKEGHGRTYNKQRNDFTLDDLKANNCRLERDDDVLSESLMSVASSQSLASDVFERAKRRQNFWDKRN